MKNRGFTLIELLIVIAIVAILAGALVPMFRVNQLTAQQAKCRADIDSIKTAAIMYHQDTGTWPPSAAAPGDNSGDDFVTDAAPVTPNWLGPYLDEWRYTPWGDVTTPKYYRLIDGLGAPTSPNSLHVCSYGDNDVVDAVPPGNADDDICLIITPDSTI